MNRPPPAAWQQQQAPPRPPPFSHPPSHVPTAGYPQQQQQQHRPASSPHSSSAPYGYIANGMQPAYPPPPAAAHYAVQSPVTSPPAFPTPSVPHYGVASEAGPSRPTINQPWHSNSYNQRRDSRQSMSPSPSAHSHSGHASDPLAAPPLALQPGRMRTQSSATLPPTRFDSYPPPMHVQQPRPSVHAQQQQQQQRPPGISGVQHGGGGPDGAPHDVNDCPGCRADFEAALEASRSSAAAESARRTQDLSEEERAQIAAIELSAAEERSRQQAEEDELLRQVMQASVRDEEEAKRRRLERQRSDEAQRAAAAESSRRDAAAAQARRDEEQRRLDAIQASVLEESRREMEREWIRRDEEERATQEFVSRGGTVGEAAYWQHLHHEGAYALAVRMNEQANGSGSSEARRPLPQPPSAEAAASPVAHVSSPRPIAQDGTAKQGLAETQLSIAADEEDPFSDTAEAPPMYDDARRDPPPEIANDAPAPLLAPPAATPVSRPHSSAGHGVLPSGVALSLATNASDLLRNESGRTVTQLNSAQPGRLDVPAQPSPGPSSPAIEIGSFDDAIRLPGEADIPGNPLLSVLADPRRLSSSSRLSPTPEAELMTATEAQHSIHKPLPASPSSELPNVIATALSRTNRQPSSDSASVQSLNAAAASANVPSPLERQDSAVSYTSGYSATSGAPSTSATSMEAGADGSRSRRSSSQQARDFSQTTMPGTDFGYACEPFAPDLFVSPKSANAVDGKSRFPNVIQLTMPAADATGITRGTDKSSFFTIRAPSWKGLLRAMAWYGNTTITAGPQEVVDAALAAEAPGARPGAEQLQLAVEVEFVTPSRLPDGALNSMLGTSNGRAAHVSLCISLFTKARAQRTPLAQALRDTSRGLDASYLRRGSARRVIALPKAAPSLPLGMVVLAQHVHAAHRFSAACPTTSSTALHSPRDLHHAVEAHDVHYIGKVALAANAAAGGASGRSGSQASLNASAEAGDITAFDDEAEEGLGTVGRLAARVKRRLKKRGGDGAVVDESLQSWITPFTDDAPVDDAWEEPGRPSFETRKSHDQSSR